MDCAEENRDLENCHSCGCAMDVSSQIPFARIVCPECGEESHVKRQLGSYKITAQHGIGGMSLVYAAEDSTLGRVVAIKLLNEDHSRDPKRIEEFEKEAKITASISHPNVVRVFTVGQAYGRYFIAMELIKGDSLEQLMRREGAVGEELLVKLAIETVEGLQAAHNEGLIHRDMKPGNVLIDSKGHAKIVDFGLALMTQGGKAMAEEIWATPYYVPPETLELKEEDLRSDIYALGASLYHAVLGKELFSTDTRSTRELIKIKAEVPRLLGAKSAATPHFAEVVDRMMAYEPADRYQSYTKLLEHLRMIENFHRSGIVPNFKEQKASSGGNKKLLVAVGLLAGAGAFFALRPSEEAADTATVDSKPVNVAMNGREAEERAVKDRVAQSLRRSMQLFENGDYAGAHTAYQQLLESGDLERETAYWASIQAAICAWLQGDSAEARSTMLQAVRGERDELSPVEARLGNLIQSLTRLDEVTVTSESLAEGFSQGALAAGLKEWEQGRWEKAQHYFQMLTEQEGEDQLKVYAGIARSYQQDYSRCMELSGVKSNSIADLEAHLAKLGSVESELETKGRAQFNLKQWRQQALKHKKQVEQRIERKRKQKLAAERKLKELARKRKLEVQRVYEEHDYAKVIKLLEKSGQSESGKWRAKHQLVASSIEALQEATFYALEDKSGQFTVYTRTKGEKFTRLLGAFRSGLKVVSEMGDVRVIEWAELAPRSMLEIHAKLKISKLPAEERRQRLAQLVVYAWRNGFDEKAETWAQQLTAEQPDFEETWKLLTSEVSDQ